MLHLLNLIAIIYIFFLFKKKYPVSLSMYWMIIFYAIYVLVPLLRNHISVMNWISFELVESLASYSLIGLVCFILTNWIFLLRWNSLGNVSLSNQTQVSFKKAKKILYMMIIASTVLFLYSIGPSGLVKIITTGSRSLWLNQTHKTIFSVFAELSFFYIAILGSVLVLSADSKIENKKATKIFTALLIILAILSFARRHVIYPLMAVIFYKLSQSNKKSKLLFMGIVLIPIFFMSMFIMGYLRTFGADNLSFSAILFYFKNGNLMDIFMSNTDFAASYKYFAAQIQYGDIFVGPLGYFKLLFTLIPRSIWPSKPAYTSVEILRILEPEKVSQGFSAASGYIGEAHASLGIVGIMIISSIWGLVCGYLDKKYQFTIKRRKEMQANNESILGFTIFEYYYLYTGILMITESHRGDFGAASIHFILEVVLVGILLKLLAKKKPKIIEYD